MGKNRSMPGEERPTEKKAGHWVLARLGKKVLRPGGKELTEKMLDGLAVTSADHVIEFAPGMGNTAKQCLQKKPASYTAVEQNAQAADIVRSYLTGPNQVCHVGNAQATGLEECKATVVYTEAMLTMQSDADKARIASEAARLLKPGGRFGMHDLCIVPTDIDPVLKREIQTSIAQSIQSPAKPLTPGEWQSLVEEAGFKVQACHVAPMHLLEPKRIIADEGLSGFLKFVWNMLSNPEARKRVIGMRRIFQKYSKHLAAIAMVAEKQ